MNMKYININWEAFSLYICTIIISIAIPRASNSPRSSEMESGSRLELGKYYDYQSHGKSAVHEGDDQVTYTAAVLEYEPSFNWDDDTKGNGILADNAEALIMYANQAKNQGANIMVTAEYGIQTLNIFDYSNDTETFLTFTLLVPNPASKIVPCNYEEPIDYFETLKTLSCNAQDLDMYLVIDLTEVVPCDEKTVAIAPWEIETRADCPEVGYIFYNTQVVFDRTGEVIARYRKQHLFNEDALTAGPSHNDDAIFYADFNVLFTLQICFDIVFEDPGYNNVRSLGIRDVVMSTAWVDYLPFYLADSVQNSWSRALEINLMVSGYHDPEKSKLGSGIYKGYAKELPEYTYDKNSGAVLIVSNVTTIAASALAAGPLRDEQSSHLFKPRAKDSKTPEYSISKGSNREENRTHIMLHENLANYTSKILDKTDGESTSEHLCSDDDFCCDLTYEYSGNLTYMLITYSGQFEAGGRYPVGVQNCAVIWCRSFAVNSCALIVGDTLPDNDKFGPFTISSNSFTSEYIYPSGNHRDLSLISNDELQFKINDTTMYSVVTEKSVNNLLVAGLCGRWYTNDGF